MLGLLLEYSIMGNVLSSCRWLLVVIESVCWWSVLEGPVYYHARRGPSFPTERQRLIWLVIYQLKVLPPGSNGQCHGLVWIINRSIPGDQGQFITKQRRNERERWGGLSEDWKRDVSRTLAHRVVKMFFVYSSKEKAGTIRYLCMCVLDFKELFIQRWKHSRNAEECNGRYFPYNES